MLLSARDVYIAFIFDVYIPFIFLTESDIHMLFFERITTGSAGWQHSQGALQEQAAGTAGALL